VADIGDGQGTTAFDSVSTRTHTASLTADLSETRLRLARLAATARANFLPLI
jgi:hypothetical protein